MRASPSLRAISAGLVAGFLTVSALGIGSARAQYAYEPDPIMPPRAVVWRLNDRGFTDVTRPQFDGRAYIVEASNPYGDRMRLFVDSRDGRIIGRQRLDVPPEPVARIARRGAPGYGWTEEDEGPRRPIREAERFVPPADIPFPQSQSRRARPASPERQDLAARTDPGLQAAPPPRAEPIDRNPMGLNPDARGSDARPKADTPRKAARSKPPVQPAAPSVTPDAPKLSDVPPAAAKIEAAPGTASAAIAPPKATSPAASGSSMTPASVQPPPADKPAAQSWKDVPAEAKRPVRVIGGATIVPGTSAKDAE
ncbi:hypothetical protein [Methylobacterium sp. J-068]|uniref:hypothetical protein n=1 Tax=Methylobacterium sp. J-068 TaxID=2836649 RepID=UPI001FB9EFED|nr:hypothetical protein [Methylobacterium sp. J-068]MCJ2033090.1 hypothetical protein [Methylobacterium sp. J-068]